MGLKVGDIGKVIRVAANFDMSSFTELTLKFKKPDGTPLVKTTADGVTAPPVPVTDPTLGDLAASTYFEYPTASGDIDQANIWEVHGEYQDGTPKLFCGDTAQFTVLPCG